MRAAAAFAAFLTAASSAAAQPDTAALRREAIVLAYNLDFENGIAKAREAIEHDPQDPANHLTLASAVWVQMLFRRGVLTVDEYLGPPVLADVARTPPPPEATRLLLGALERARDLARQRLRRNPDDADALYCEGAAAGRLAAYIATEEGRLIGAFRAARRAYETHDRLLRLDPTRHDAGLITGTYRYLVATLSLFERWIAYLVGFDGNKPTAFRLLEDCALVPNDAQAEARLGLVIIYSREERHADALRVLALLRQAYPDNRLLWLETGATLLRDKRPAEALEWLTEGIERLSRDPRVRSVGEEAVWHYKRGTALAELGRGPEAGTEAATAAALPARKWQRGRILTLQGQSEDLAGHRAEALQLYRRGVELCREGNDPLGVLDAKRWIDKAFVGTSAVPGRQYN
jgi:hypothetical protein